MYKKNKKYLFEQDEKPRGAPEKDVYVNADVKSRKSMHSLDDQIDALILRYEEKSIEKEKDSLSESLKKKSLKFLFEQEEEEVEDTGEDSAEESDTSGAAEPSGSETMQVKNAGKQIIPNLNIDEFASRTLRLINNPTALLDIETVIVNRVKNFLNENYGDEFVTRYINILEQEYGIEIEEFNTFDQDDSYPEIFAPGATGGSSGV